MKLPYDILPKPSRRSTFLKVMFLMFIVAGCTKLAEVDPPVTSITGGSAYSNDITATAVLTNLYSSLSAANGGINSVAGLPTITKRAGLSADELALWTGAATGDIAYYTNTLAAPASGGITAGSEVWATCYGYLYTCNSAIEGLTASGSLTPAVKQQLLGEAKFMRAFFYFYLVNLFGDIPLAISSDYKLNSLLGRTSKSSVYLQIIADLKDAEILLSTTYLNGQLKTYSTMAARLRPTTWAATALLARVYLYSGDYTDAISEASKLISNSSLFSLNTLSTAFLAAGNNEAIWQLQPVSMSGSLFWNTEDARLFVLSAAPVGVNSTHTVSLSSQLLAAFEPGDGRRINWVSTYTDGTGTYNFSNKYKIGAAGSSVSEYLMVLRLGEQFLIRAEAEAQLNQLSLAITDLNAIRARAGGILPLPSSLTQTQIIAAVAHERQVELFAEWGHRWLDLKRTGKIDSVMNIVTPIKANGLAWNTTQQLYPLPIVDILANPNLTQNPGY